jgi:uracil-DNA glycosylase family 4
VSLTAARADAALSAATYAEFRETLRTSGCDKCPSLAAARNSIVIDRGNPTAKILIVGEAPGETEDRMGQAFVGRSGKVLDEVFASIGLDTNRDTLIANVVKCRPPNNRPPSPLEATHCKPYLLRQIELQNPRAVVLLGATAARHVAPDDARPMRDRVGKLFDSHAFPNILFQILYHPAFLLRDPRRKPETKAHVVALRDRLIELGVL